MGKILARSFFKAVVIFSLLLCAALSLFSSSSRAHPEPESSAVKPLTLFTPPAFSYSSVFDNYHGYQDQEVASWLEANETVGEIGGWRYYLEEAFQPPNNRSEVPPHHPGHGNRQ